MEQTFSETHGRPCYCDISEVIELAAQGRRLAVYERGTGLFAYWYVQLRAEEEIARGMRGGRPFACISLWAPLMRNAGA